MKEEQNFFFFYNLFKEEVEEEEEEKEKKPLKKTNFAFINADYYLKTKMIKKFSFQVFFQGIL